MPAGYTLVQHPAGHTVNGTPSASCTVTLSATGAGNFLALIWVTAVATSESVLSVVDSASNNWTATYNQTDVTGCSSGIYYLPSASNAGGITSVVITFNQVQSGILCQVNEYSGLQGAIPVAGFDKSAHQLSSAQPSTSPATPAVSQNNELVIGVSNNISAGGVPGWTVGAGYSNLISSSFDFAGPATLYMATEDKEITGGGAQTATFGNPNIAQGGTSVATFREGAAGSITKASNILLMGA